MEFGVAFLFAVVAVNKRLGVVIFRGHLMLGKHGIDTFKVLCHISQRFEAGGALIRGLNIFLVAFVVNAMSARLFF